MDFDFFSYNRYGGGGHASFLRAIQVGVAARNFDVKNAAPSF